MSGNSPKADLVTPTLENPSTAFAISSNASSLRSDRRLRASCTPISNCPSRYRRYIKVCFRLPSQPVDATFGDTPISITIRPADMGQKEHWERVYSSNLTERLGWYEPHLQTTLTWIQELGLGEDARIIDVGGGASTLVDDLLDKEFQHLTILDLSERALATVRTRLGAAVDKVT